MTAKTAEEHLKAAAKDAWLVACTAHEVSRLAKAAFDDALHDANVADLALSKAKEDSLPKKD